MVADFCHVKGYGSCSIQNGENCTIASWGRCTVGNAHCQVFVEATCAPSINQCAVLSETATSCESRNGMNGNLITGAVAGAGAAAGAHGLGDGNAGSTAGAGASATIMNGNLRRGLNPIVNATVESEAASFIQDTPILDDNCLTESEGDSTCEVNDGLCELIIDKVCIVWVGLEDDEDVTREEDIKKSTRLLHAIYTKSRL